MASHRVSLRTRVRPATWTAASVAALVWGGVMSARLWRVRSLMRAAEPFSQHPPRPSERVVIAGDSTAVGAGSSHPRLSVAGRIGMALAKAEVSNVARSGARLADVPQQLDRLDPDRLLEPGRAVSLVIVLCGGEDVVRGASRRNISNAIDGIAARLRALGARLILVPPGVLGRAPIWLPPLSSYYTWQARRVRRAIFEAARNHADVEVIDLAPARPAHRFPHGERNYASDRLHPSDVGYGAWFERIVQQSAHLRARLVGPFRLRVVKSAKSFKWSPHILRAAVR